MWTGQVHARHFMAQPAKSHPGLAVCIYRFSSRNKNRLGWSRPGRVSSGLASG
ncbi:MAG: hypothetical protein Q7T80_05475 [Methanoregula sp.]|nr:hypothetical protein [Methanoregula sp.]